MSFSRSKRTRFWMENGRRFSPKFACVFIAKTNAILGTVFGATFSSFSLALRQYKVDAMPWAHRAARQMASSRLAALSTAGRHRVHPVAAASCTPRISCLPAFSRRNARNRGFCICVPPESFGPIGSSSFLDAFPAPEFRSTRKTFVAGHAFRAGFRAVSHAKMPSFFARKVNQFCVQKYIQFFCRNRVDFGLENGIILVAKFNQYLSRFLALKRCHFWSQIHDNN